jgi:hypothetical protein
MTDPETMADCPLHRKTPFIICGVSQTQFSIARYYGGINYNGDSFTYNPTSDELVRNDVLKWMAKRDNQAKKQAKQAKQTSNQQDLL